MDHATTKFQVKIKEALHISWKQPSLNKQLYLVNLTLSFSLARYYYTLFGYLYFVRFLIYFTLVIYLCLALYYKFKCNS